MRSDNRCCYNCKDRVVGCHSTCERYAEFKAIQKEFKELKDKDRMINNTLEGLAYNRFDAISKSKKEV